MISRKHLLLSLISISSLNCATSSLEQAINNSDYNSFINLYNNPKLTIAQDKAELRQIAEKVLHDRVKTCKDQKYSKTDKKRIVGGGILAILSLWAVHDFKFMFTEAADELEPLVKIMKEKSGANYPTTSMIKDMLTDCQCKNILAYRVFPILFCAITARVGSYKAIKTVFSGYKHKDNFEKLRDAAAIKHILDNDTLEIIKQG